eukprot:TRINITY_DN4727_c0_g2_i1.p1 TRINITY_DN4727_c0_g2~~TRINITY_DN4727_c0_g2_i1.p1  ORF type:complete len:356 (-),score=34.59 TRINITY_DN4727_c0_g2_i1:69-1136(-)
MVRLARDSTTEEKAVLRLLQYRLPANEADAKEEWSAIVEGKHTLWDEISEAYKETIRAFLIHFHCEVLKAASLHFEFCYGSVGNFFLTGTRLFFHSLETSLFWFARVSGCHPDSTVLPVLNTNHAVTIGVELENGTRILGQNEISHPVKTTTTTTTTSSILGASSQHRLQVHKESTDDLESPIKRLFYLNQDKQEILPQCNPTVLKKLQDECAIVYAIGSLWTSIIPCLVLGGVGEAIAQKHCPKIFLLNGYPDRETRGCTAVDFIMSATNALNRWGALQHKANDYFTHILYIQTSEVLVDERRLQDLGLTVMSVPPASTGSLLSSSSSSSTRAKPCYEEAALTSTIKSILETWK